MASWASRSGGGRRGRRVRVRVRRVQFTIEEIHFADNAAGSDFHYLYQESDTHAIAPGNLRGWGIGAKITDPEWTRPTGARWPACFTRRRPVAMRVKLRATDLSLVRSDLRLRLWVNPRVDGSRDHLKVSSAEFTYGAGAANAVLTISTAGKLPDEIGRFGVEFRWALTSPNGRTTYAISPEKTTHQIYGIYGQPFLPAYDSSSPGNTGTNTTRDQGTLTGTKKRFDLLMLLIGGSSRRATVATAPDINNLIWRLHSGINDTPGAPPYFDAGHDQHLTHNGTSSGTSIPLEDQWLAWVPTPSTGSRDPSAQHWNDASCIGHVQVFKTMIAAAGLFVRRTWVLPYTKRLPDGTMLTPPDTDLYMLGQYDGSRLQSRSFTFGARTYQASVKLMEPDIEWENFEACLRSPAGRFLPGGYPTSTNPAWMRTNKGFRSAAELIRWWSGTVRRSWRGRPISRFQRFLAWVYYNQSTGETHFWDVNGLHYNAPDYERIRNSRLQLPPP